MDVDSIELDLSRSMEAMQLEVMVFEFHVSIDFHQVLEDVFDDIVELKVVQIVLNQHILFQHVQLLFDLISFSMVESDDEIFSF